MENEIVITNIFWDRIYLHIQLEGQELNSRQFAIATNKNHYLYPLEFNSNSHSITINITNIAHKEMLTNGIWYIKCFNPHFEEEMQQYEFEMEKYQIILNEDPDNVIEKPLIPLEWNNIPISLDVAYKLKDLDKIYRYGGSSYAYIVSLHSSKRRQQIICSIHTAYMMKNRDYKKRHFKVETKVFKKRMKKRIIYFLEKTNNFIYTLVSHLTPKNGKRVLIMSETRVPISGNLKVLDERLKERGLDKEFKISYFFKKTLEHKRWQIFFIWLRLVFLTAKQDFIFIDDFSPFFKYIKLNPKTKLIQVWHAGVGFKSVGYARFGEKGSPYPDDCPHRKYDYTIVGGNALKEVYAEAFGIDKENCLPFGLMRIDGYMDSSKIQNFKETFYQQYPNFKNKKIILFAPTFRGTGQRSAHYPYKQLDLEQIYQMCGEEYLFLVKMHPFIRKPIEIDPRFSDRIIDFSSYPDINELFYVTDILITDYSSNIYEFSLQEKPIIFFAFDKFEYELLRSVHRKLDEYAPGKVCLSFDEVIETIQNKDFEMEKLHKFINENFDNSTTFASDKVIDHILLKK